MNPFNLAIKEIGHRWKSSLMVMLLVATTTGALTYFAVNGAGFQKEIGRNARDIGSNVVILPADVNQFRYFADGGFSEATMPDEVVQQLIEYKASLNHLIPMLERKAECKHGANTATARVVGIAASIPMPGRPKAPMQKSIAEGRVQLGSSLASELGVSRDDDTEIEILGQVFKVDHVNRSNGTWQDSALLMDLAAMQTLFKLPRQISRIEAIECTSEQCELTGLKSDVVLANELARITDQALLLRRDQMAAARSNIRTVSRMNFGILQNVLWASLTLALIALAGINYFQRQSEIGTLLALGKGPAFVASLFLLRAVVLTVVGAAVGISISAVVSQIQSQSLFEVTGKKMTIDWPAAIMIGIIATTLAGLVSSLPAILAATRNPAEIMGKDA